MSGELTNAYPEDGLDCRRAGPPDRTSQAVEVEVLTTVLAAARVDVARLIADGALEPVDGAARVYRLAGAPPDPELDGIRAVWLQLGDARPVGYENVVTASELGVYAARSYSLIMKAGFDSTIVGAEVTW